MPCRRREPPAACDGQPTGDMDPAPDGGWGIVIVAAAFAVTMLTSFMTGCAGVLYFSWQHEFDSSAAQTGAIASIMSSSSFFFTPVASVVYNRRGCRFTWILGGLVMLAASVGSVWASDIFLLYVVGAVLGAGVSLSYLAAHVAVAEYFDKYYAIAVAIMTTGIGAAFVVFPPLLRLLLDTYGWRGTMLLTGGISANICSIGALYRPLHRKRRAKEYIPVADRADTPALTDGDLSSDPSDDTFKPVSARGKRKCSYFTDPLLCMSSALGLDLLRKSYRFSLLCLLNLEFNIFCSCFPVFLLPSAQNTGISEQAAPFLFSAMGVGSVCARLVVGFCVTRRTPVEAVVTLSFVLCCVGYICALFQTYAAFAAAACIVGVGTGANRAIITVLLRKIVGLSNVASGLGIYFFWGGVGDLLGPIIGGTLFDYTGSFQTLYYVLAGLSAVTALQMCLMPVLRRIEPGVQAEPGVTADGRM